MAYENLIVERDGKVVWISLNRPQVLNALTPELFVELRDVLAEVDEDADVGVVVITGAGRAFSAGVDLKSVQARAQGGPDLTVEARAALAAIEGLDKPVIAMVNGHCLTGGLELALACDMIVASENAVFGDTHARWGLRPVWGGSWRLPRQVGIMKAKELSFTAQMIPAAEAERIGLVNKVVPIDELKQTVADLAQKLLANSAGSIGAIKRLMNRGLSLDLAGSMRLEIEMPHQVKDQGDRLQTFGKRTD
jgi:enoyl-CoA hydratase/carnithine racemase